MKTVGITACRGYREPGRTSGRSRGPCAVRRAISMFSPAAHNRRARTIVSHLPGVSWSPTSRSISAHHGRHLVRDAERRQHAHAWMIAGFILLTILFDAILHAIRHHLHP